MSQWLGGATQRQTPRSTTELLGVGIGVTKTDRADLKSNDIKSYQKVRESAVAEMKNKFTQLKAIDEKATMEHLESVYSVVTRFDDLKEELIKSDMIDVFTVPSSFTFDSTVNTHVPASDAKSIDLFKDVNNTDIDVIKKATAYYALLGKDYHGENVQWSGEKILNSCDGPLRDKLIESTRDWDTASKGGPSYLKLLLSLILSTSEKSLRALTERLSMIRITEFKGENVNLAVSYIRGVILILSDNHCKPNDLKNIIFRIFKASTVPAFKTHVDNMDSFIEFNVTSFTVDSILTNLDQKYVELLGRNEWTAISTTNQGSAFSITSDTHRIICFNCGGIGHGVNECPVSPNKEAIDLRREIMESYGKRFGDKSIGSGGRDRDKKVVDSKILFLFHLVVAIHTLRPLTERHIIGVESLGVVDGQAIKPLSMLIHLRVLSLQTMNLVQPLHHQELREVPFQKLCLHPTTLKQTSVQPGLLTDLFTILGRLSNVTQIRSSHYPLSSVPLLLLCPLK